MCDSGKGCGGLWFSVLCCVYVFLLLLSLFLRLCFLLFVGVASVANAQAIIERLRTIYYFASVGAGQGYIT